MGLFSIGARLVSKVLQNAVKPAAKKAYRAAKVMPDMLLGTSADAFGTGFKAAKGSKFIERLKGGFRSIEADVAAKSAGGKGFFRRLASDIYHTPGDLWSGIKNGFKGGKGLGKIWGATKGVGKAIAKKMPMIGALAIAAFDGPEVYHAFKEGGFKEGMKELFGVGIELGAMAAGAAIGSCFGPVGTIIGGIVGAIGGGFLRGKTWSEKTEEVKEQQLYNDLKALGLSDEEVEYCIENGVTVEQAQKVLNETKKQNQVEEQEKQASAKEQPKSRAGVEPDMLPKKAAKDKVAAPLPSFVTNPIVIPIPVDSLNLVQPNDTIITNPFVLQNVSNEDMNPQLVEENEEVEKDSAEEKTQVTEGADENDNFLKKYPWLITEPNDVEEDYEPIPEEEPETLEEEEKVQPVEVEEKFELPKPFNPEAVEDDDEDSSYNPFGDELIDSEYKRKYFA